MSILSGEFLLFLTALLTVYYIVPLRLRWCALTLFSLGFYAFAGWQGLCWLLAAALVFYGAALAAQALREREERLRAAGETRPARRALRSRRAVVGAALAASMGVLVFVKAASPLGALLSALGAGERLSSMRVLAPLGLSYCTFQGAGYLLDVAWGRQQAERHPLKFLLFMAFFPQLAQGPISTYAQLAPQLSRPAAFEPAAFVAGFERVIWGYFKKLVIADRLAAFAVEAGQPGWMLLLGAALYAVRLYADFSGGMDVALGAARMLGVELPENFRRPFFAQSVAEYWRRWHITLGAWFRAYLFYPLCTSPLGLLLARAGRLLLGKKAGRALPGAVATLVIFALIGLWHAVNLSALLYGAYFGLLLGGALLLEPLFARLRSGLRVRGESRLWRAFCRARTLLLILPAQFFAVTAQADTAVALLGGTVRNWSFDGAGALLLQVMPALEWGIAGAGMLLLLAVDLLCERGVAVDRRLAEGTIAVRWPALILLIAATLVFGHYGAGYDATAFLYAQF